MARSSISWQTHISYEPTPSVPNHTVIRKYRYICVACNHWHESLGMLPSQPERKPATVTARARVGCQRVQYVYVVCGAACNGASELSTVCQCTMYSTPFVPCHGGALDFGYDMPKERKKKHVGALGSGHAAKAEFMPDSGTMIAELAELACTGCMRHGCVGDRCGDRAISRIRTAIFLRRYGKVVPQSVIRFRISSQASFFSLSEQSVPPIRAHSSFQVQVA